MIKVFWLAFLTGIAGVTVVALVEMPVGRAGYLTIKTAGITCLALGTIGPLWFGRKFSKLCKQEPESWSEK